jgi:hypothetical protein
MGITQSRKIKCTKCGLIWNVSPHIKENGYLCPMCAYPKRKKNFLKKHAVYIITWAVGLGLMPTMVRAATVERGYKAIGGEIFVPLLIFLVVALVKQVSEEIEDEKI